jgi:predicted nuclease with TOPRIM domain
VITSLQSLKQLEALVKQASEALKGANADNAALREKLARLESEHRRVKEELREAKLALGRHERIRSRLVKLSEKLEKIA